jgi:glucokinase
MNGEAMRESDEQALLADIGGTNARFALIAGDGAPLEHIRSLRCADYARLEEAIAAYLGELGQRPRRAAIAVATALTGETVKMTNHVWSFSLGEVARRLGFAELRVMNDFTALALAIPALQPQELRQVGGGAPVAGTPLALIGPGTGLGVSGLVPAGERFIPLHSEGGHVTYGAANPRESEILAVIGRRFGHVSAERLVSGPGMVNLYQALADLAGVQAEAYAPAEISRKGMSGECPLCVEALATFCSVLGTAAGNLVLTLGARAGVYIGGGIVPRLGAYFERSRFRDAFEHRGRFTSYLQAVPSYVIQAEHPALRGAAQAFGRPAHEVGVRVGDR